MAKCDVCASVLPPLRLAGLRLNRRLVFSLGYCLAVFVGQAVVFALDWRFGPARRAYEQLTAAVVAAPLRFLGIYYVWWPAWRHVAHGGSGRWWAFALVGGVLLMGDTVVVWDLLR